MTGLFNIFVVPAGHSRAAERRKIPAHGASRGVYVSAMGAPEGRKKKMQSGERAR